MTTKSDCTKAQLFADRDRARALRWLLKTARTHGLLMPARVQFNEMQHDGKTLRWMSLGLDDEADPTGWADAIGAAETLELPVTGETEAWTYCESSTGFREGPRIDWHCVTVSARRGIRPRTDPAAVTA